MRIQGVSKRFGDQPVLENFCLEVANQGFTCFYGRSGCGKTTLLHIIAGLIRPDAGQIQGIQGMNISYVFQEDRLLPWLSALENVAVVGEQADAHAAMQWLERMGIAEAAHQLPDTLSGGQRRRVALARAMHHGGDLLLMDEPFKGLDAGLKADVMHVIRQYSRNKAGILVTHDMDEALGLCHNIVLLTGPVLNVLGRVALDNPCDAGETALAAKQMQEILAN